MLLASRRKIYFGFQLNNNADFFTFQIVDVPSTKLAMFLEIVQAALPQGVNLSVHEHQPEHEQIRYVPDYELKELKAQLEEASQKKK